MGWSGYGRLGQWGGCSIRMPPHLQRAECSVERPSDGVAQQSGHPLPERADRVGNTSQLSLPRHGVPPPHQIRRRLGRRFQIVGVEGLGERGGKRAERGLGGAAQAAGDEGDREGAQRGEKCIVRHHLPPHISWVRSRRGKG